MTHDHEHVTHDLETHDPLTQQVNETVRYTKSREHSIQKYKHKQNVQ